MPYYKIVLVFIILSALLLGCTDDRFDEIPGGSAVSLEKISFPPQFSFSTARFVDIELTAPAKLAKSLFDIYYRNPAKEYVMVARGVMNLQGKYLYKVTIPAISDTLYVSSRSIGLEKWVAIPIKQNKATYDYGVHFNAPRETDFAFGSTLKSAQLTTFSYMGTYTANGYPSYLHTVNDHAWESLLSNLNQTLPEGVSVPSTKPQFLEDGKLSNLKLKEKSNVYVTFAAEGTNLTSALGYYIHTGTKPTGTQHKIIFPNASYPGSGGSLHSGDKVLLGEFPAGTVIGWFLVPNGWNKINKTVIDNLGIYYSEYTYNPGDAANNLDHYMIMMKDIQNEVIVLGFEDTPRNSPACDHDFNDAVFYITLDRLEAADLSNVNNTTSPVDTDGDGIIDSLDEYPLDPDKAFNNGGGNGSTGSLAFEDLWPEKGDYDFNDLVLDYQFNPITDANNLIKTLDIKVSIRHLGGSFRNGFGIEFPVAPSAVQSVTGSKYAKSLINLNANGTENGQAKATVILFDDGWSFSGQSFTVSVTFVNAVSAATLGSYPYNPFMIVNGIRGREIHLPDYAPTTLADPSWFRQGADYSRPENGLYYRSTQNLPWAIIVTGGYAVPVEKAAISKGYLKFVDWAKSAGSQFPDWYLDLTGYRDYSFLN